MHLGILECGTPPAALFPRFGRYARMVRAMLGEGHETLVYDVTRGVLPAAATDCDAYIVTGSPAAVYDDLPWIAPLLDFLRQARGQAGLVGICFGHQAMATAFGGTVEKSAKGWGIGLHAYDVVRPAAWMDTDGPVRVSAAHQDQVVLCPPGARVVAESAFTPFAGLDYGDAVSFQFHPEFGAAFGTALIEERRDTLGPLADPAIASYRSPDDNARVAAWIGRFLDARPWAGATSPAAGSPHTHQPRARPPIAPHPLAPVITPGSS